MASSRFDRKLAAILYADVEGYSRLIGLDEERTHQTVTAYLDLFSQFIRARGGRIGHFAGDAVLADFDSVLDALGCALEIQREIARKNRGVQEGRKVQFRIGINLGDVIADGGEVHGDGVNIAARLETLAEAGGVCVSAGVVDAIGNKLPVRFEYLGEQQLKNIAQPVRAYNATAAPDAEFPKPSGPRPGAAPRARRSRLAWSVLAAIVTFASRGAPGQALGRRLAIDESGR